MAQQQMCVDEPVEVIDDLRACGVAYAAIHGRVVLVLGAITDPHEDAQSIRFEW